MSDFSTFDIFSSPVLEINSDEYEESLWATGSSYKDDFSHDAFLRISENTDLDRLSEADSKTDDLIGLADACAEFDGKVEKLTYSQLPILSHEKFISNEETDHYLQLLLHSVPKYFIDNPSSTASIVRGASNYIKNLTVCLQVSDLYTGHTDKQHYMGQRTSVDYLDTKTYSSHLYTQCNSAGYGGGMWCSQVCSQHPCGSLCIPQPYSPCFPWSDWPEELDPRSDLPYTLIKEKSRQHEFPEAYPLGVSSSSCNYSRSGTFGQSRSQTYGTADGFSDTQSPPSEYSGTPSGTPSGMSPGLLCQFRREYPAFSTIFDLDDEDIFSTNEKRDSKDVSVSNVSSSRGSESTDTDLDLSLNADDDNVFLENCVNPDDVILDLPSTVSEPDSTTDMGEKVTTTGKEHNKTGSVRRPKNGFIRFSVEYRKRLALQRPKLDNREVSKMLGAKWRRMSQEEKEPYENEFKNDIQDIKKRHPDWRYAPLKRLSHDQIEPMPSRLRPRDKLKRKFSTSIAKGIKLPRSSSMSSTKNTKRETSKKKSQKEAAATSSVDLIGFRWMQCCLCFKWRYVPFLTGSPYQPLWICQMNPDPSCNSCFINENWRVQQGK